MSNIIQGRAGSMVKKKKNTKIKDLIIFPTIFLIKLQPDFIMRRNLLQEIEIFLLLLIPGKAHGSC